MADPATISAGIACLMAVIVLFCFKVLWGFLHEIHRMNQERREDQEFYKREILKIWGVLDGINLSDRLKELGEEAAENFLVDLESLNQESVGSPPLKKRLSRDSTPDGKASRLSSR